MKVYAPPVSIPGAQIQKNMHLPQSNSTPEVTNSKCLSKNSIIKCFLGNFLRFRYLFVYVYCNYLLLLRWHLFHQGTYNLCNTSCWHWVHNNHPHQNCSQLYSTDHRKVHLQPNQDDYILFKNLFVFIIYFLFVDFFPKRKTKFLKKSRNRKKTSRTSRKSNKIEGYGNRSQKRKEKWYQSINRKGILS